MSDKKFSAGVKEYRQNYWMPDYQPLDTDILACFKITPQAGVDREEVAAAVAAESSTGTWTTVWMARYRLIHGQTCNRRATTSSICAP